MNEQQNKTTFDEADALGYRRVRFSEADRQQVTMRAAKGLVNITLAQLVMLIIACIVCALYGGQAGAVSAAIGGLAYLIPSALFVARMLLRLYAGTSAKGSTFFWAQAFKLGGAAAILFIAVKFVGADAIVWSALLIGLIAVLKGYVLLLVFNKLV